MFTNHRRNVMSNIKSANGKMRSRLNSASGAGAEDGFVRSTGSVMRLLKMRLM
jgi:hypothetical protein